MLKCHCCRYLDHFPSVSENSQLVFEKSAGYFDSELAPHRIYALLPQVRLICLLVHPARRAYSWYQVQSARCLHAHVHTELDILCYVDYLIVFRHSVLHTGWTTGAVLGRQNTSSVQPPSNMAAANFVAITNGEGCALNGTAVAAVLINQ